MNLAYVPMKWAGIRCAIMFICKKLTLSWNTTRMVKKCYHPGTMESSCWLGQTQDYIKNNVSKTQKLLCAWLECKYFNEEMDWG